MCTFVTYVWLYTCIHICMYEAMTSIIVKETTHNDQPTADCCLGRSSADAHDWSWHSHVFNHPKLFESNSVRKSPINLFIDDCCLALAKPWASPTAQDGCHNATEHLRHKREKQICRLRSRAGELWATNGPPSAFQLLWPCVAHGMSATLKYWEKLITSKPITSVLQYCDKNSKGVAIKIICCSIVSISQLIRPPPCRFLIKLILSYHPWILGISSCARLSFLEESATKRIWMEPSNDKQIKNNKKNPHE